MKNYIFLFFPFFLFGCFGPSEEEINQAKQEIFQSGSSIPNTSQNDVSKERSSPIETSYMKINYLSGEKFLEVSPVGDMQKIKNRIDIVGIVHNPDIEKIKVSFSNPTSKFPTDEYELKTFKKGNKNFLYRAYHDYAVLDNGLNTYMIDGYVGENLVSKIEVEIFIANPGQNTPLSQTGGSLKTASGVSSISFSGNIFENLPSNNDIYGTPSVNENEGVFSYSKIPEFIGTKNNELSGISCENFADYLKQNYTWYYWNTCRPINNTQSFWVNVLTLTGDQFNYEKHYLSPELGIYGRMMLESGSGLQQEDLVRKNDELKSKTFDTSAGDMLFQDLVKNSY